MLKFLRPKQPPRNKQSHLSTIVTEGGRTHVTFFRTSNHPSPSAANPITHDDDPTPSSPSLSSSSSSLQTTPTGPLPSAVMRSHVPPISTIHEPPYHFHTRQNETFKIKSGAMLATVDGAQRLMSAGASITVQAGQYHSFINPSRTEDLVVDIGLDPPRPDPNAGMNHKEGKKAVRGPTDEMFFRNWYGYFDDCHRAGTTPCIFQLMLWLWVFECFLVVPGPWPACCRRVRNAISKAGTLVLGVVVGKWCLGFHESYGEYYDPEHVNDLERDGDCEVEDEGAGRIKEE